MDRNDPQKVEEADNVGDLYQGVPATQTSSFRQHDRRQVRPHPYRADGPELQRLFDAAQTFRRWCALKRDTVERTIQTIGNRINQLG